MLKVNDINVYYGNIHALKGISLEVHEDEIVALIGANGAGKSTTLKTISGLIEMDFFVFFICIIASFSVIVNQFLSFSVIF